MHMTGPLDRKPGLAPEDERLVRALARHYTPEPLSEAARAAFDARLRERLAARPRRALLVPLATAAALGLTAWLGLSQLRAAPAVPDAPGPAVAETEEEAVDRWEYALLFESLVPAEEADDEALPDDYAVIADLWLAEGT
jgi:hypothetical protein